MTRAQDAFRGPLAAFMLLALVASAGGCAEAVYDTSTPERTLDAMAKMIEDGRPDLLISLVHIEARDIRFDDGVTEESAIGDVKKKTADLFTQLWRVSRKLNERYPGQVVEEVEFARTFPLLSGPWERPVGEFLVSPFAFIERERDRLTAIDLGDDTAAILWDSEPPFGGIGLQMVRTREGWKIDLPVDLPPISNFRPQTRHEWAVLANMMLGFENALKDFEHKLDRGEFRSLADAANQAGRMLGESAVVQGMIYAFMKRGSESPPG